MNIRKTAGIGAAMAAAVIGLSACGGQSFQEAVSEQVPKANMTKAKAYADMVCDQGGDPKSMFALIDYSDATAQAAQAMAIHQCKDDYVNSVKKIALAFSDDGKLTAKDKAGLKRMRGVDEDDADAVLTAMGKRDMPQEEETPPAYADPDAPKPSGGDPNCENPSTGGEYEACLQMGITPPPPGGGDQSQEADQGPQVLDFGESVTGKHTGKGVTITVAQPEQVQLTDTAASDDPAPGEVPYKVTLTIEVAKDAKAYDSNAIITTATSGDHEAATWLDDGAEGTPGTKVLPGRTLTFSVGFFAKPGEHLTVEVGSGLADVGIWDGVVK